MAEPQYGSAKPLMDLQLQRNGQEDPVSLGLVTPDPSPVEEGRGFISPVPAIADLSASLGALDLKNLDVLKEISGKGFTEIEPFYNLLRDRQFQQLETHFKWMVEMDGEAVKDRSRILTLKEKMLSWVGESDTHLTVCTTVTQKLLLAVYTSFLEGESEDCLNYFKDAMATISASKGEDAEENLRVYRYVGMIDKLVVIRSALILNNTDTSDEYLSQLIDSIYEDLKQCDPQECERLRFLYNDVNKATFVALKGQLANQLGHTHVALELFEKAVKLNPESFDWTYHLCTSMRRFRREQDFHSVPSERERQLCIKASELRPDYWKSYLLMANMYEDSNKRGLTHEQKDANISKAVFNLEKAQALAPNNVSVNLKLAEAYSTMKKPNIQAAEALFEHCKSTWPNNSQVYHKIGKFYNMKKHDTRSAKEYFEKGLENDTLNFPCLMDYFRLMISSSSINQMLQLVDKYLPEYKYKKVFYGKLVILKGYLLWQLNEALEALKTWLAVFDGNVEEAERATLEKYMKETFSGGNHILSGATYARNFVQSGAVKQKFVQYKSELWDSVEDFEAKAGALQSFLNTINQPTQKQWRTNSANSSECGDEGLNWRTTGQRRQNQNSIPFSGQGDQRYNKAEDVPKLISIATHEDGNWRRRQISNEYALQNYTPDQNHNLIDSQQYGHIANEQNNHADIVDLRNTLNEIRDRGGRSTDSQNRTNYDQNRRNRTNDSTSRIRYDENGRWLQVSQRDVEGYARETSYGRNNWRNLPR